MAGTAVPKNLDGMSVADAIYGTPQKEHDYFYWEFEQGEPFKQAARTGNWKGVKTDSDKPLQLYDLETDLGEEINLADKYPDEVNKIEGILKKAHSENENWPLIDRKQKKWKS